MYLFSSIFRRVVSPIRSTVLTSETLIYSLLLSHYYTLFKLQTQNDLLLTTQITYYSPINYTVLKTNQYSLLKLLTAHVATTYYLNYLLLTHAAE